MINREALQAVLAVTVDSRAVEKALFDADLEPGETYSSSSKDKINACAIEVLEGILSQPDISEGGYSIKYDRSAVKLRLDALRAKTGTSATPKIAGLNVW